MRNYVYENQWKNLLTPDIVALLTQIHEYKGQQTLFLNSNKDELTELVEIAKIQSVDASNRIEGIYTSDERLKKIVQDKTTPKTREEFEIAGYRDVLNTIHDSYEHIPLKPPIILQLHRDLYKFSGMDIGGRYKSSDNIIAEIDGKGNKSVRFQPVASWETDESIASLCRELEVALGNKVIDSLLLIPMFILDFLCIHPFDDGNGRMSRLITLLMLYKSGYMVGKYVSLEKIIDSSKETYYEVLKASSDGWHENKNDYKPFVKYILGVILSAYREFSNRVLLVTTKGMSKADRVKHVIKEAVGEVSKSEILEKCPDISQVTVQRALNDLITRKEITKIGGGRYTKYVWNWEE